MKVVSGSNFWMSSLCSLIFIWALTEAKTNVYEFRMPGVRTHKDDTYLCYAEDFTRNKSFITGFQPMHDEEVTHHMILFGCEEPGSENIVWHCDGSEGSAPVCKTQPKVIFSWAMNAPSFTMPPDTSLPIGGTPYRYLVLQVHYKDASSFAKSPEKQDRSGWKLNLQSEPTPYVGGVYLFASNQPIPANSNSTNTIACIYTGKATLHPFAFRVHAHKHGVVNEGYVIHNGKRYLIGEESPKKPQTFYPVKNQSLEVQPGDVLTARCNMTNTEDRDIPIGHTRKDEMCNFYMMYSVELADIRQLDDPNNQDCNQDILPGMNILNPDPADLLDPFLYNELEDLDNPNSDWEPEDQWLVDSDS